MHAFLVTALLAASTSGAPGSLDPRGLALGPDGAGLLGVQADTTDYSDGVSCRKLPTTTGFAGIRRADGSLAPLKPLGSDLLAGPIRLADGTFAAVLGAKTALSGECAPVRTIELATLDAAGAITARSPLAAGVTLNALSLRPGATGGAAVAWLEEGDGEDGDAYALRLAADGAPPVTVAQGTGLEPQNPGITDAALAAAPDGGYLLAWAVPKRVLAAEIAPGGALGPATGIGPADSVTSVLAGVARNGRAVIAWATQDGGEERNRPLNVRAAIRPRAGAAFGHPRLLDRGHSIESPEGGISLAVAPDGRALLAWADVLGHVERRFPLYTTLTGRTGGFRPVRRAGLLGSDQSFGEIQATAFTRNGTAVLATFSRGRLRVMRRPPGATRFSAPKPFARAYPLDITADASGRLLATYVTYPKRRNGRVHVAPLPG